MALTHCNMELIRAVANNDIFYAKKAALASLNEDTSKKNASTVNYYKKLLEGSNSELMMNLPMNLKDILIGEIPEGFDAARYYVRISDSHIIEDIIRMKAVSDEMEVRKIPYKNTTLLYGESGTGKTELGRYIAYKLNLPFFYVSFVSTIDSYMGSTAKNIHRVFEYCSSMPCVLMLDEIDCISAKRTAAGGKGSDGEIERTTIALMQELDRIPNRVTLIAATNRPDIMDPAVMRRFSLKHEVIAMSASEILDMIEKYLDATNTKKYVEDYQIRQFMKNGSNPGRVMPELIKLIGKGIYEEMEEKNES